MDDIKAAFQSKTVWASLVTILASLLGVVGVTLTPDDQAFLVTVGVGAVTAITGLVALYGRLRANTRIGGMFKPDPAKAPAPSSSPSSGIILP